MKTHYLLAVAGVAVAGIAALSSCAGGASGEAAASELPEAQMGKIYGEFEDARLFEKSLESSPELRFWSEKELCDGLSGATIQSKSFGRPVPDRKVISGGRVLAYADGFGQYWLRLLPGSYELVGRCKGYRDAKATVTVAPESIQYLNFYLERR